MRWLEARLLLFAGTGVGVLACSALYDLSALGPGDGVGTDGGDAGAVDAGEGGTTGADGGGGSDGAIGDDGQASPDARTEGGPLKTDGGCPLGEGPAMIRGETTCIDATEVTAGHYLKFLQADAGAVFAPAICNWNTSLSPEPQRTGDEYTWPPAATDMDYPVQFVDWCDAATYCAWAGKQLCGAVASGGISYNDFADASASQWYQACSRNGTRQYPYPGSYAPDVCAVDVDGGGPSGVARVGAYPGCEGGYAKIVDMVGNVYEWLDSCDGDGKTDLCSVAGGGSFDTSPAESGQDCTEIIPYDRDLRMSFIGFRCCARP
jgi:formylglycine-generating enzyme